MKKIKKNLQKMDITEIISTHANLLVSYIDQLRSHFNISHLYTISVPQIFYDEPSHFYSVIF